MATGSGSGRDLPVFTIARGAAGRAAGSGCKSGEGLQVWETLGSFRAPESGDCAVVHSPDAFTEHDATRVGPIDGTSRD
jgi:hypothetical protein